MPCCDAMPLCRTALVFLAAVSHCRLVYDVLSAIAPQSPPSYFQVSPPCASMFGIIFSLVHWHASSQVASHDVIALWTSVLFSPGPVPLGFWLDSTGCEHHTNKQTISANILHTYLQWSHASVYFTCTHPRITKPKGNSYLGILSKNNSYNKG